MPHDVAIPTLARASNVARFFRPMAWKNKVDAGLLAFGVEVLDGVNGLQQPQILTGMR